MKHYWVISPEMSEVVPVTDDGQGPREYFACCVAVEANNKREALKAAVKHPDMQPWVNECRWGGRNPFTGLYVEDPVCKHGVCCCDLCKQACDACFDELATEEDE